MDSEAQRQLASFQRTLVQMNLRLTRIGEIVEGGTRADAAADPSNELLFDLLEAIDRTLRQPQPALPAPPWLARWLGWAPPPPFDLSGLALAREHAVQQLARAGITPVRADGPVDPALHHVIDVRSTDDPALDGSLATTHRTGWAAAGDPPRVIRFAQVTAWRHGKAP